MVPDQYSIADGAYSYFNPDLDIKLYHNPEYLFATGAFKRPRTLKEAVTTVYDWAT